MALRPIKLKSPGKSATWTEPVGPTPGKPPVKTPWGQRKPKPPKAGLRANGPFGGVQIHIGKWW